MGTSKRKFDLGFSKIVLSTFIVLLPVSLLFQKVMNWMFSPVLSFTLIHLVLLPFCRDYRSVLWFILTYVHGLAHIYHPAFVGTTYNTNYTPLYDFVVHSAECLCIYYYSKKLFPIGIMVHSIVFCGALLAHLDNAFMGNPFWLFVSGCGVFGVHWHMMLLNKSKDNDVFWTSVLIWVLPYLGYLNFDFIPYWDSVVNSVSLFSMWFFNWFITYKVYELIKLRLQLPVG